MQRSEVNLQWHHFLEAIHFGFWDKVSHQSSLISPGFLVNECQESACFSSPGAGIACTHDHVWLFNVSYGIELRSLWWLGNYFTDWLIFPAPQGRVWRPKTTTKSSGCYSMDLCQTDHMMCELFPLLIRTECDWDINKWQMLVSLSLSPKSVLTLSAIPFLC